MTILEAIFLGIVQGLTEFLPVSSSGHLAVIQNLLEIQEEKILFFTVMLHIGTLISVFFVYYKDIVSICREFICMILEFISGNGFKVNNTHRKLGILIIVSTIPTGFMGIVFNDIFTEFYASTLTIGIALTITGTLLWAAEKYHSGRKSIQHMNWFDAVVVGLFQGIAITPGISRSGATIVGSLFRGFDKELATKFSFLISIPAILGAIIIETKDAVSGGIGDITIGIIFAGILASFISGIFAIRTLINFIKKGKLFYFSCYTWIFGGIIIVLSLWK